MSFVQPTLTARVYVVGDRVLVVAIVFFQELRWYGVQETAVPLRKIWPVL